MSSFNFIIQREKGFCNNLHNIEVAWKFVQIHIDALQRKGEGKQIFLCGRYWIQMWVFEQNAKTYMYINISIYIEFI